MKNKNGRIFFWGLICAMAFSLNSVAKAADDHSHFNAEKVKSGVFYQRHWRTQQQINEDWFVYNWVYPAGDINAAYYDAELDGGILPVRANGTSDNGLGSLGKENNLGSPVTISNQLWVQYETYHQARFFDDDFGDWINNMKLFRLYTSGADCPADPSGGKRLFTMHWMGSRGGEIQPAYSCPNYGLTDVNTGYFHLKDAWTRVTILIDVAHDLNKVYLTDINTGATTLIYTAAATYPESLHLTSVLMQLQSTYRNHYPCSTIPSCAAAGGYDTFIGYRNLILSTNQIAFASNSGAGTPGDLNSDGKVDIFDYSLFISSFGKTGTGLAADLNSDGKVDIFDYSMFISNFGK